MKTHLESVWKHLCPFQLPYGAQMQNLIAPVVKTLTPWPFAWPTRVSVYVWLQVVGLYRLCGSAAVKKELREAFERDSYAVELSESVYPDINVITGMTLTCSRKLLSLTLGMHIFVIT